MPDPEEKKNTVADSGTQESKPGAGRGRAARWAARAALLAIAICVVITFAAAVSGVSAQNALPFLGLMILGPVFTWFLVWSITKTYERAADAKGGGKSAQEGEIDTVVFDIGNVLADFSWYEWITGSGYPQDIIDRVIRASFFSPAWNEIDRGVLNMDAVIDGIVKNDPALETEIRDIFTRSFHGIVSRRERAVPWVRELKAAGYRVYYLSNFSLVAERDCADALDFIPLTDGGIMSYREKLTKPDPAIYRLLIDRYHLTPAHAVFLDDKPENVRAACETGMRGIVVTSEAQAEEALRAMGVIY